MEFKTLCIVKYHGATDTRGSRWSYNIVDGFGTKCKKFISIDNTYCGSEQWTRDLKELGYNIDYYSEDNKQYYLFISEIEQ